MARLLGEEYGAFLASYGAVPRSGLRVNTLKLSAEEFRLLSPFALEPIPWASHAFLLADATEHAGTVASSTEGIVNAGRHPHHAAGLYYLQEPSAMAAAELLDPQPGQRVLDMAAAPGGKATHVASLMRGEGLLVANEIHRRRVWDLAENLERWGARNAVVTNESPDRLADRFAGYFDRVLLDAPCSGEGMFRKSEAARRDWSPEFVQGCALRQTLILEQAACMVRPGGRLAYVTCTFAPEENERVVARFLRSHGDFALVDLPRRPGFGYGRPEWAPAGLGSQELRRAVRLWPHDGPGEGHFIAVLQRLAGGADSSVQLWRRERVLQQVRHLFDGFCREILTMGPAGDDLALVGSYLYALPSDIPDLSGLRFIHPGWWLGTIKKDRFEPSHGLALGLSLADVDPGHVVDLPGDGTEALAYLRGESISHGGPSGWVLVAVDGFPLGWGKRTGGILKSRYPKGLRY
jgi:NOL1/NOP2/sun family putative RNA methylase